MTRRWLSSSPGKADWRKQLRHANRVVNFRPTLGPDESGYRETRHRRLPPPWEDGNVGDIDRPPNGEPPAPAKAQTKVRAVSWWPAEPCVKGRRNAISPFWTIAYVKRMGRDSNPRWTYAQSSFQDCRLRPLGHPSGVVGEWANVSGSGGGCQKGGRRVAPLTARGGGDTKGVSEAVAPRRREIERPTGDASSGPSVVGAARYVNGKELERGD
jgi:hypothetical protein